MTTDLDQDIYKDDYEFMNDQLMQFNEKDKLPMPSTEEFKDYKVDSNILLAPSIKIVQEGIFQVWHRYVKHHRLQLYHYCVEHDISKNIKLVIKNPQLEPQRMLRESTLQQCYVGYISIDDFVKLSFNLIQERSFHDFIQVMQALNVSYNSINYMKLIRNTYMCNPILEELHHFNRNTQLIKHSKESAIAAIQTAYRRYKYHVTEAQKQIKALTNLSATDLMEVLTKRIKNSQSSLKEIFEMFDINKDGNITFEEFVTAFRDSKIIIATEILRSVFKQLDANNSNSIQYMEFLNKVQVTSVSNESLLTVQLKVENSLQQLRTVMHREFTDFEECFNTLKAQDRLKIKQEEFIDFVVHNTLRFSKIQLDQLFHYLDSNSKGYLNIEDFSLVYLVKNPTAMRQDAAQRQSQDDVAMKQMRNQIEDAKQLYHYIQAENMGHFIEQQNNQLVNLLHSGTGSRKQSLINTASIDSRVNIFKNQLLKLEILVQQTSLKCLAKLKESGLSLKQFFSQFTQRFPEKFMDPKEFTLMLNMLFNTATDTGLVMAIFKIFSNFYVARISYDKFEQMIQLGQQISPIQLRMKYQYGSYINKLKPRILEEFQKQALLSPDLNTVTLRQTFEVLKKFNLNLEMFEVQRLSDSGIITLSERRYIVDWMRLLDLLFPDGYLVEQVILKTYAHIILKIWNRIKSNYFNKVYIMLYQSRNKHQRINQRKQQLRRK